MSQNPYSSPVDSMGGSAPSFGPSANDSLFQGTRPLLESAGWLKLLGWVNIIIGGFYCITIIGAIIGWLPLWIGFLLKNAGERMANGHASQNPRPIYQSCKDLKTVFTIMGILMLINLVFLALYVLAIIAALFLGVAFNS